MGVHRKRKQKEKFYTLSMGAHRNEKKAEKKN